MSPVVGFFGKLHFLILHFPIALLFGALIVELALRRRDRDNKRRDVVNILLLLAAASAVVTVATGLTHAADEEFHGHALTLLTQHRAGGIATAILSIVCAATFRMPNAKAAFLPLLVISTVAVSFTGTRGGDLVHGDGYLFKSFRGEDDKKEDGDDGKPVVSDGDEGAEERTRHPEGKIPDQPTYAADIKPLIDRSCLKCHGPEKRKGGLRLDKKRFAMKGGETGDAIVPGNADKSLLFKYVNLPPDDEDVMPSKGKLLAQSEIATIKKWIDAGAEWPDDG